MEAVPLGYGTTWLCPAALTRVEKRNENEKKNKKLNNRTSPGPIPFRGCAVNLRKRDSGALPRKQFPQDARCGRFGGRTGVGGRKICKGTAPKSPREIESPSLSRRRFAFRRRRAARPPIARARSGVK
ncbi:hypothetical protein EVAR_65482_1 [Eumeta japonica]|uniref:Uncharacterized protein n=1 Tax=Eumeta variegata TaxID=151549 RepID=A0A4C2A7S3_EUMVA|nr:hypothetical protein EVAR_65482_1 [Eumeta japonica]